jgi:hypothetical protein
MKIKAILTITEPEAAIKTPGWDIGDVLDWARRNPEECTFMAGTEVLHVDAVEVLPQQWTEKDVKLTSTGYELSDEAAAEVLRASEKR